MKKILSLVCVSALGGLLTLGGYKLFIEDEKPVLVEETPQELPVFIPTSTGLNTTTAIEVPNFESAAEKTIDAVVHVKNTAIVSAPASLQDLFYGRRSQRAQIGTGSGVIISPDGYIITNNHVIASAREISITLNNNKSFIAELVGTDTDTDIALLKIDTDEDLPFITFGDSDDAKIGEWVLAVGNPFNLTSTVTAGIISAKARDLTGRSEQSFIQTDAAVNPGNSGGALVNSSGELIGINTAISSQTGSYIGYSFAVPSNIARKVVNDIMEYGNVQNGILGVVGGTLNSKAAKKYKLNTTEGFYVSDVEKDTGADKAGIRSGDVIKKIDNIDISKFSDLRGYLKTKNPNDIINVEVLRDDEIKNIQVTLSSSEMSSIEFMDLKLRNLPSNIKEKYDISNGVLIQDNQNRWLYHNVGIRRGYIITSINDTKIESIEDISRLKAKYGNDFESNIEKLGYINNDLERKEIIFR